MARYDEAQADYAAFSSIMGEVGMEISSDELDFKKDLDSRAAAGGERRRRDELIRAVDVSATNIVMV
jgi:hypothetical protein